MSTARKRTKASKEQARSSDSASKLTASAPPSGAAAAAATATASRRTDVRSSGRYYLRALLGLLSLACFLLAALPYFQTGGQDIFTAPEPVKSTPDAETYQTKPRSPKASPRAQESVLPFELLARSPPSTIVRSADVSKLSAVKEAFQDSWNAYVEDAFGADEYHPISRSGSNFSVDGGVGYFIIDILDVLLIMGEEKEFERATKWVRQIDWSSKSGKFSVFEVSISQHVEWKEAKMI
jgi:hypothetical protein